jgi:hypothetical protein
MQTPLHDQNSGVSCAISRSRVIFPIFEDTRFWPLLVTDSAPFYCFQQDGATGSYCSCLLRSTHDVFGENWFPGTFGHWSRLILVPRSFVCGEQWKRHFSKTPPHYLLCLKEVISNCIKNTLHAEFVSVFTIEIKWVDACLQTLVVHFQHLL